MNYIGIIAMIAVFIIREITHYKHDERKDKLISELTDKIKASSFTEYKEQTTPTQTFEPVSNDDTTLFWKEIEEAKQ